MPGIFVSPSPLDPEDRDGLERHRRLLWLTAALAILGGVLAIMMPLVASVAATVGTGGLLTVVGLVQLVAGCRACSARRLVATAAMGTLTLATGLILLLFPAAGIVALASVLTGYLLVAGALKIWFALKLRPALNWGWMALGGAAALLLGLLLLSGLPGDAFWVLGLFLGLDLLAYGAGLVGLLIGTGIARQSEHRRPIEGPR